MPYIRQPPWARYAERIIITLAYLLILGFGLGLTGPTVFVISAVQIIGSMTALFGVLTGRYRWEWVSLCPLIASLLMASVLMSHGNGVVFIIVTSLLLLQRFLYLTAVAKRLRRE